MLFHYEVTTVAKSFLDHYAEHYQLQRTQGYRLGRIQTSRKILLRIVRIYSEEQDFKPNKALVRKIMRETDMVIMNKMMMDVAGRRLTVAELESSFDMIFLTEEEKRSGEHAVYKSW